MLALYCVNSDSNASVKSYWTPLYLHRRGRRDGPLDGREGRALLLERHQVRRVGHRHVPEDGRRLLRDRLPVLLLHQPRVRHLRFLVYFVGSI